MKPQWVEGALGYVSDRRGSVTTHAGNLVEEH
jgi:hypothetical protein